jgi:biotin--protein ligase
MGQIAIYVDEGVSGFAVLQTVKSLQREIDVSRHPIVRLSARDIRTTPWEKSTSLLVIPGGRDRLYQELLGLEGIAKIRKFVEMGGTYFGFCAGAYFASSEIEFEKGSPYEVCGKRELQFFPGLARGAAYGPRQYAPQSERGVRAASLSWKGETTHVYFNGGCLFPNTAAHPNVEVIATYSDLEGEPAAVIACTHGKGLAILSGAHIEYQPHHLPSTCPYNQTILPKLHQANPTRRLLFRSLLERTGILLT